MEPKQTRTTRLTLTETDWHVSSVPAKRGHRRWEDPRFTKNLRADQTDSQRGLRVETVPAYKRQAGRLKVEDGASAVRLLEGSQVGTVVAPGRVEIR